jgi:glycosyltransferase involved in cell wall biosynthesis
MASARYITFRRFHDGGSPPLFDIAHLCFRPSSAPGSYNRNIGAYVRQTADLRQIALSFCARPGERPTDETTIVLDRRGLTWPQRALRRLPARVRGRLFGGIQDADKLTYWWHASRLLPMLRPRMVICYDDYKLGPLLRRGINWNCRLIFSQHGHVYHAPTEVAARLYSLQAFDHICVLTHAAYRDTRSQLHAFEPLVTVLPNGVDTEAFHPATSAERTTARASLGLPDDRPVVLLLGRLVPKKGAHAVLQAWPEVLQRVPDAFLWIVGSAEPAYHQYLDRMIRVLGLSEAVRLHGQVAPEAAPACYRAADLCVNPTLCAEGHSLAILEAMSSGLACIVSEHPGVQELYANDEVLVVPDPNVEGAFVAPLVRLLQHPEQRRAFGDAARRAVETRYDRRITFQRMRAFHQRQLSLVPRSA